MANNKKFDNSPINWYPGHMAKTKREIREKINLIDIIYEVIDARMPISSKIKDIDDLIKDKPRILIMTKYDLCDKKEKRRPTEKNVLPSRSPLSYVSINRYYSTGIFLFTFLLPTKA